MYFKKNRLFIERVEALKVVKKFGTPTYCYSLEKLKNNIKNFQRSFKSINPLSKLMSTKSTEAPQ